MVKHSKDSRRSFLLPLLCNEWNASLCPKSPKEAFHLIMELDHKGAQVFPRKSTNSADKNCPSTQN